jgi:glycosyltransferase involved in cell wall biosynthesis
MKKVAIIYHYIAHYRYPIFYELSQSNKNEYYLISGLETNCKIKTLDPTSSLENTNNDGIKWKIIRNRWLFSNKILWQTDILKPSFFQDYDCYIYLGNPYFISTWISASIARMLNKPVYFWTHGVLKKETGIKKIIRYIYYKIPSGLFLYGNRAKKILMSSGFDGNKLHVIYNSLDYRKQLKIRNKLDKESIYNIKSTLFFNNNNFQLLFIGRLTKQKKIDQLIQALHVINNNVAVINLLIVGDGEEKNRLQNLVSDLKLNDNVYFYGSLYDENTIGKLLASSDICVSPGEVGLTAMHSLVYGTPVITHGNLDNQGPEVESIVRGKTGDFFEENNIDDLAYKIMEWLENTDDKDMIKKQCYQIIDLKYNPIYQRRKIDYVINNSK